MIPSAYGRKRFNVLGFLDSETHEVEIVSNSTYITANEVVKGFEEIRNKNGSQKIYVVLDNARYQRCEKVIEGAKEYDIEIKFLPTYSPNLNLIERLWKFLRGEVLCNKYKMTFAEFGESVLECLRNTATVYAEKLDGLLAHNFEILNSNIK